MTRQVYKADKAGRREKQSVERSAVIVRVIIERHLEEGRRVDLFPLLREFRAAAIHQPGYITGEPIA